MNTTEPDDGTAASIHTHKRQGEIARPFGVIQRDLALGDDVYEFAESAPIAKLDGSLNSSKQGIVFAQSYVLAGLVARTTLAHNDRATRDELAGKHLDTEPLRIRI